MGIMKEFDEALTGLKKQYDRLQLPQKGIYAKYIKRCLDFAAALVLTPFIFIFVWPLVALAIKLDSKGVVMFKQDRIGRDMKSFRIFKFRTMFSTTYAQSGKGKKKVGFAQHAHDQRVTKVGALLRKYSIDELPQVLNILRGDMSFIGPRPFIMSDMTELGEEHLVRQCVRPGMTGWAQVNGRNDLNVEQRQRYDIEYVNNVTFMMDVKVLLKTIKIVFSGKGAN